jgi:hypothetical protein
MWEILDTLDGGKVMAEEKELAIIDQKTNSLVFDLPGGKEWAQMTHIANIIAESGLAPKGVKTWQQVTTIMLKARELNIPTMTALSKIHVIHGQPTVAPELMLALVRRSGLLEDFEIVDRSKTQCTIRIKRIGETKHTETYTIEEAEDMGLKGKDNYNKQPATMLYNRCLSRACRIIFGDVVTGLYLTEEIRPDYVDEDTQPEFTVDTETGEIQDGEVTEETRTEAPSAPQSDAKDNQDTSTSTPENAQSKPLPTDETMMSELTSDHIGAIVQSSLQVAGVENEYGWRGRMKNHYPEANGNYKQVPGTFGDFWAKMATSSTQEDSGQDEEVTLVWSEEERNTFKKLVTSARLGPLNIFITKYAKMSPAEFYVKYTPGQAAKFLKEVQK